MSNAMTLFGGNTKVSTLLNGLEDELTNTLAGSGGGMRRLSIEGGVFREIVGGKEVRKSEDRAINIVLIKAAPVNRTYYTGTYVKGQKIKPTCWSLDTQKPDASVPEGNRQANACKDCKQNIKGSGQGETRACRFQQRVAVMLEGDLQGDNVYQLALPATSIFGDADGAKMPLQAYGRHLKAHNTHAISIVTEMRFDTDSATPKLTFKPVRPLEEEELKTALAMREHPDTLKAVTYTVSQADGVQEVEEPFETPKPVEAPAPKAVAAPKKAAPKVEEDEPVEEPIKVSKKSTAPVAEPAGDLASLVEGWDD